MIISNKINNYPLISFNTQSISKYFLSFQNSLKAGLIETEFKQVSHIQTHFLSFWYISEDLNRAIVITDDRWKEVQTV